MHRPIRFVSFLLVALIAAVTVAGQQGAKNGEIVSPKDYRPPIMVASPALQSIVDAAVAETLREFGPKKVTERKLPSGARITAAIDKAQRAERIYWIENRSIET